MFLLSSGPRMLTYTNLIMSFQQTLVFAKVTCHFLSRLKAVLTTGPEISLQRWVPEVDGLEDIVSKENVERMRRLERQKTDRAKKQRVTFKQKRQHEQQKRLHVFACGFSTLSTVK